MTSSSAATPPASGTPVRTCARCGHQTGGCPRCGRDDYLLGGRIGDHEYCHVNSPTAPTCYTQENWDIAKRPEGYVIALKDYLNPSEPDTDDPECE